MWAGLDGSRYVYVHVYTPEHVFDTCTCALLDIFCVSVWYIPYLFTVLCCRCLAHFPPADTYGSDGSVQDVSVYHFSYCTTTSSLDLLLPFLHFVVTAAHSSSTSFPTFYSSFNLSFSFVHFSFFSFLLFSFIFLNSYMCDLRVHVLYLCEPPIMFAAAVCKLCRC